MGEGIKRISREKKSVWDQLRLPGQIIVSAHTAEEESFVHIHELVSCGSSEFWAILGCAQGLLLHSGVTTSRPGGIILDARG